MPTLTIQLPGLPPVDHILRDEMMTIGRMKGNTIALDDASVSVSHAKITRKGSEFFLKDLNSTNGTMLNGQSINEARLKDGDQVKFGEVVARYRSEPDFAGAAGSTPVAAPSPAPVPTPSPVAPPTPQVAPLPPPVATPVLTPTPAPAPAIAATAFVSKRLVVQAAQPSTAAPSPSTSSQTVRTSRPQKKVVAWQMPAAIGGVVLVIALAVVAKFFSGGDATTKTAPVTNPPTVTTPVKNNLPNAPVANSPARPGTPTAKKPAPPTPAVSSVADLKKALKAVDPADRRQAAAKLRELGAGAKDALPELRAALEDSDADVRMWSALALINNKAYDKATIPILIQVLQNNNSMLRQISCLSLALIPYEDADKEKVVTALTDTANKDEDDDVRKAAVSALKIIAPEAVPAEK